MVDLTQTDEIVCTHEDGRTTVRSRKCQVLPSGMNYVTMEVNILSTIDVILDVKIRSSSPKTTCYGPEMVTISGQTVGLTLHNTAAGSTICWETVCTGY